MVKLNSATSVNSCIGEAYIALRSAYHILSRMATDPTEGRDKKHIVAFDGAEADRKLMEVNAILDQMEKLIYPHETFEECLERVQTYLDEDLDK